MLSIIIPAYKAKAFLDECIASITEPCEILIGVDNCQETMEHIKNNKGLYSRARLFYFTENVGPFVIKNSLSDEASHGKLLFFDADDVMIKGTIKQVDKLLDHTPYVKLNYLNFFKLNKPDIHLRNDAVIAIRKDLFNKMNGFIDWRCAADTEFLKRLQFNHVKYSNAFGPCYYRRLHGGNLTMRPETNFVSPLRKKYIDIIQTNDKNRHWKNPKTKIKSEYHASD